MDAGPLLRNRSIQLGWILLPPLIMLTLFILLEVSFHSVERRLDTAVSQAQAIPVLEQALVRAVAAREAFHPVSGRVDAERINAMLHAIAMDCGVQLNTLSVVHDASGAPSFCHTEIRADGTLHALGTFIHRVQHATSLSSLEFARLTSAGPGTPPMYSCEFNLHIYGVAHP